MDSISTDNHIKKFTLPSSPKKVLYDLNYTNLIKQGVTTEQVRIMLP